MKQRSPQKEYFEVPGIDGCACNACPYMRLNTLEKVHECLLSLEPQIHLDSEIRVKALKPIKRMLELSK